MIQVLAAIVALVVAALIVAALTGRAKVSSCCGTAAAHPDRDLRLRPAASPDVSPDRG